MATTLAERAQSAMLTPERAESALAKDVPHVDREERVRNRLSTKAAVRTTPLASMAAAACSFVDPILKHCHHATYL